MSHESRLDRLGLLHLKDDPEALQKELERRAAETRKREEAFEAERQRLIAADRKKSGGPQG